jgi:hypothetical protein
MKKEPNRFHAIYGAGKRPKARSRRRKAKGFYKQLVEMCEDGGHGTAQTSVLRERWRTSASGEWRVGSGS